MNWPNDPYFIISYAHRLGSVPDHKVTVFPSSTPLHPDSLACCLLFLFPSWNWRRNRLLRYLPQLIWFVYRKDFKSLRKDCNRALVAFKVLQYRIYITKQDPLLPNHFYFEAKTTTINDKQCMMHILPSGQQKHHGENVHFIDSRQIRYNANTQVLK